jgi:aminoglycoside phosphotransferase (APT) family kinase protein
MAERAEALGRGLGRFLGVRRRALGSELTPQPSSAYIRLAVQIAGMSRGPPRKDSIGPPAEGERRDWAELPRVVRDALEEHLRARVIRADSEPGGFSPGVAARLELSDGRRLFAKIVGREPNPDSPDFHRAEARILAQLPPAVPAPRLLSVYDDGEWVALFLREVEGHTPRLPWKPSELRRVVRAMESLAESLTPAPFSARSFGEEHARLFTRWREMASTLRRDPRSLGDVDPWVRSHIRELVELEERLSIASSGTTLLHSDLRADNILITKDRVFFADWPAACIGAPWVDLLCFLPSVAMQGGPRPWTIFDESPLSRDVPWEDVNSVLASVTGFFFADSRKPAPPGLSTLRPFQHAQGVEALAWLRHRWDEGRGTEVRRAG